MSAACESGSRARWFRAGASILGIAAMSCRGDAELGRPIRLVDAHDARTMRGDAPEAEPPRRTEWRFDGGAPASEVWRAGPDVADLAVRGGLLTGRTTGTFPVLHLERTGPIDNADQLHSVEIRLRVSAGANLSFQARDSETVDLASQRAMALRVPWSSTPVVAGDEMRTYTVAPGFSLQGTGARWRHLLLRPTDAAGASFAVESVRLVFRREQLMAIPSGVGWQGMRDVFRESLVARSPQSARFDVRLPSRSWLDLAVGTVEERPVTFRVRVTAGARRLEAVRTITSAFRWEPLELELSALAGQTATLELTLESEPPGALGFWGAPVVRARGKTTAGSPRGVVLVQADTLRRDGLDAYGHSRATAPALNRLAREGVLFRHAFAQAPWTKVSTPTILASLYPSTHGVRGHNDRLPASAETLAEVYRRAGYATLGVAAFPFVGQATNLHQGFEELHEGTSLASRSGPLVSKTAREQVDRVLQWIERHRDDPFFVYLQLGDPHSPYEPYAPYNSLWVDPARRERHVREREAVSKQVADEFMKTRQLPPRADVERAGFDPVAYVAVERDWYDASVRAMDVELGRLFERLGEWGLESDVLFALLSDHGTEFYERGYFFHGHSVYGELINVPLILRWPAGGLGTGRVVEEPVETIDVAPTLLEASGLAKPETFQGESLLPLLGEATEARPRPAFAEHTPWNDDQLPPRNRSYLAVIEGEWKLVQQTAPVAGVELYAWRRDPLDTVDLAANHPDVVDRLATLLERWRREALAAKLAADSESAKDLAPEELERLRSLGYIQ